MKYFLHDSNAFNDEKVTELYLRFGYEGLGLFYTILEKLSAQEKPIKTIVLKSQLSVGKKLEKCWLFMEEIQLISSNNGETFNKQLLNFSEKYKIKKQKNTERIAEWRKNQELKENVTCYESVSNTHKVKESKVKESKINIEIDEIYNLYPSNCPVKNSSTGKTLKNKDKIKSLLTSKSKDEIISIIIRYTKECRENKIYMKNFSTFLNNLPDYSQLTQQTVNKNRKVHYRMLGREHTHYEKAYFENLQSLGSEQVQFLNYVENAD